eukprot:5782158-Pyramimonas_sp.AAC.1
MRCRDCALPKCVGSRAHACHPANSAGVLNLMRHVSLIARSVGATRSIVPIASYGGGGSVTLP